MRQETINIYTIEDHPNKEACFEWIRSNWHDLGDDILREMIGSLEALAEAVNGKLDCCLSIVPDVSEYVNITDYDVSALRELEAIKDECPLTGLCYDYDVIVGLSNDALDIQVLNVLHSEGEYLYSDEGLTVMCLANEYEFNEDGSIH